MSALPLVTDDALLSTVELPEALAVSAPRPDLRVIAGGAAPDQLDLVPWLEARAAVQNAGVTRHKVDIDMMLAEGGPASRMPHVVVGTRSLYDPTTHRKFIHHTDWPYGRHELARPYLRWIHEAQTKGVSKNAMVSRRVPWRTEQLPMLNIPHPLYFPGGSLNGDWAYVDISSAYFQVYSPATLDLVFNPDRQHLGVGRVEFLGADQLGDDRALRNALIGVCRTQRVSELLHGELHTRPVHNRFLAPQLWGYIAYTLHAVAREAVERFGACYVHTDGIIVPANRAEALMRWLADEWRLESKIKAQGPGSVWCVGGYRVGDVSSNVPASDRGRTICNFLNLDPQTHRMLRRWRGWLLDRTRGVSTVAPQITNLSDGPRKNDPARRYGDMSTFQDRTTATEGTAA